MICALLVYLRVVSKLNGKVVANFVGGSGYSIQIGCSEEVHRLGIFKCGFGWVQKRNKELLSFYFYLLNFYSVSKCRIEMALDMIWNWLLLQFCCSEYDSHIMCQICFHCEIV